MTGPRSKKKIENLLGDPSFWRSATTSVAVIITADQTYIHRLSIGRRSILCK